MQTFRRSVFTVTAITVALSLSAAPREPQKQTPQRRQTQQKNGSTSPWMRLIHQLLDDVIPPPPDNKLSVPPG